MKINGGENEQQETEEEHIDTRSRKVIKEQQDSAKEVYCEKRVMEINTP